MASSSTKSIELSLEQCQQLVELSRLTGKPWQQVFAEALAAYVPVAKMSNDNEPESLFDAASRLGLIGCLDGGPADLSTNPKYMEWFGTSDS